MTKESTITNLLMNFPQIIYRRLTLHKFLNFHKLTKRLLIIKLRHSSAKLSLAPFFTIMHNFILISSPFNAQPPR